MLGIRSYHRVNLGDTAELFETLYDEREVAVPADSIALVRFTVQRPNKSQVTRLGEVLDDGQGFLRWSETTIVGPYTYVAQFTLSSGEIRSSRGSFEVLDPLNPPLPTTTERIANTVWSKLEDCFDSEEGGPWLRDVTLKYFDEQKIPEFIGEALLDINIASPTTSASLADFTIEMPDGTDDPDMPILTQGVLLAVIRHLMRSYVEQPMPQGAAVVYEDRRDYLQRWQIIYQIEEARFNRIVALWKRQFIGLGKSKMLVAAKAGRLLPAPLRTRNIGRGYY